MKEEKFVNVGIWGENITTLFINNRVVISITILSCYFLLNLGFNKPHLGSISSF